MENNEKKFVEGLWIKTTETQYGEIIKLSFNTDKFVPYLSDNENDRGYVNIDIMTTKSGEKYAKLNDWKPEKQD